MTKDMLVCFRVAAELQHITKAADKLYLSQSALSKMIRALEDELEVSLFQRQGRNVVLTAAGQAFYNHVARALDELDAGITEARHYMEVESNTIGLSVLFSDFAKHLPERILAFHRSCPLCHFSVEYKYSSAIVRDLFSGSVELGICGFVPDTGDYQKLEKHLLCREPASLVVGKNHPAAKTGVIAAEDLKDQTFIVWNWSRLGINEEIRKLSERFGFSPRIGFEGRHDLAVLNAVAVGEGIAVVPVTGQLDLSHVVPVRLDTDFPLAREIFLAWRKDIKLSSLAVQFRNMLLSENPENVQSP